jgi:hypothetical protein
MLIKLKTLVVENQGYKRSASAKDIYINSDNIVLIGISFLLLSFRQRAKLRSILHLVQVIISMLKSANNHKARGC